MAIYYTVPFNKLKIYYRAGVLPDPNLRKSNTCNTEKKFFLPAAVFFLYFRSSLIPIALYTHWNNRLIPSCIKLFLKLDKLLFLTIDQIK